ncbi:MAG: fimbria/pilus outer membrane usher protein [Pseudobdellovibrionaceae bacterium]
MKFLLFIVFIISIIPVVGFSEPSKYPVFVTFILDNEPIGEVAAYPDEDSPANSLLNFESLAETISSIISPEGLTRINSLVKDNKLKVEDLTRSGWKAQFDLSKLELQLDIPPAQRSPKGISIGYRARKNIGAQVLKPSTASGYFNYLINKGYTPSNQLLTGTLQSVANFNGLILEDNHTYTDSVQYPWRRSESRAVFDDTNHLIRYSLGDLRYPSTGFQNLTSIGGVSFTRDFTIDPLSSFTTTSRTSFTLTQHSSVTIYVNNQMYRTLQLKPGRYDVTDLPINAGFNDVELVIMDSFGKTERLKFPYVFSSELLRVGLQKFSHNFGFASQQQNDDINYDNQNFTYSGFHRIGITPTWTGGLNLQKNKNQSVFGAESFIGNTWGAFNIDLARSESPLNNSDLAGRIRFRSWSSLTDPIRDWGLGIEKYGNQFVAFGSNQPNNLNSTAVDIFVSPQWNNSFITTLGLSQRWAMENYEGSKTASLRVYKTVSQDIHVTAEASVTEMQFSGNQGRLFVSLNWSDFTSGLNQSVGYDTINSAAHYDLQKNDQRNIFNVMLDDTNQYDAASARFFHNGQRINIAADYEKNRFKNSELTTNDTTNLYVSGAFAWTSEGDFGISAPIHDSFAILNLSEDLRNTIIDVNRNGTKSEFSSAGWGHLVIPNLVGYTERPIRLDCDSSYLISELDSQEFTLKPSYKSGISKKISLHSTFVVHGRLLLSNKTPLSLKSGEIQSLNSKFEAITFFTNKEGFFEIDRLLPGRYRMLFNDDGLHPLEFLIPKDTQGFYDLGDLTVESEREI